MIWNSGGRTGMLRTPENVNIEDKKVNIQKLFTAKTASHICKLQEEFGFHAIFGKSDVDPEADRKPFAERGYRYLYAVHTH